MPRGFLLHLILCFAIIVTTALAGQDASFTGSWEASNGDVSDFSLDLVQTGNLVQGYHSSIAHSGKRIDAVLPKEGAPSITGTVSKGVARVYFQSGYDKSGRGEAVLTLRGDNLQWKVVKSTGVHYIPTTSVLHRLKTNRPKK
jgi:hypothetical protein